MSLNTPHHANEYTGAAAPSAIKQLLLFNLESYSPQQKEKMKGVMKKVFDGIYSRQPEKPFHTISIDQQEELSAFLDDVMRLFSGEEEYRKSAKQQIYDFIESGKKNAITGGGQPVDRVLFFYKHDLYGFHTDTPFGDAINDANNIDMRDEDGNGGIEDRIVFPGSPFDTDGGTFALINATEDLIQKRPNAIIITITKAPRRKFNTLMHQYFHEGVAKYSPDVVENIWNATDEEMYDRFSYSNDGER